MANNISAALTSGSVGVLLGKGEGTFEPTVADDAGGVHHTLDCGRRCEQRRQAGPGGGECVRGAQLLGRVFEQRLGGRAVGTVMELSRRLRIMTQAGLGP